MKSGSNAKRLKETVSTWKIQIGQCWWGRWPQELRLPSYRAATLILVDADKGVLTRGLPDCLGRHIASAQAEQAKDRSEDRRAIVLLCGLMSVWHLRPIAGVWRPHGGCGRIGKAPGSTDRVGGQPR